MYSKLQSVCESLGEGFEFDPKWIDEIEQRKNAIKDRLDNELLSAKSKMIKDSIRSCYFDLGDFHDVCGNLIDARNSYLRTREYCQTPRHMVSDGTL